MHVNLLLIELLFMLLLLLSCLNLSFLDSVELALQLLDCLLKLVNLWLYLAFFRVLTLRAIDVKRRFRE